MNESRGFDTWFLQITIPKVIKKCVETFLTSQETFFCKNLKMTNCHFWANVSLRQPHVRESRAFPDQKSRGLRVVFSKNFSRRTFFVFWRTHLVNMFLRYLPVKQIWRKSAVCYCVSLHNTLCFISNAAIGPPRAFFPTFDGRCFWLLIFLSYLEIVFLN